MAEVNRQTILYGRLTRAELDGDEELIEKLKNDIQSIDTYLMSLNPPMIFDGTDDTLNTIQKGFERVCYIMKQNNISHPEKLTVYEFYSNLGFIEEQNTPKK